MCNRLLTSSTGTAPCPTRLGVFSGPSSTACSSFSKSSYFFFLKLAGHPFSLTDFFPCLVLTLGSVLLVFSKDCESSFACFHPHDLLLLVLELRFYPNMWTTSLSSPLSSCSSWAVRICYLALSFGNPPRANARSRHGVRKPRVSCQQPTLPTLTSIALGHLVDGHFPLPLCMRRRAKILPSSVLDGVELVMASVVKEKRPQHSKVSLSHFPFGHTYSLSLLRLLDLTACPDPPPLCSSSYERSLEILAYTLP